MISIKDTAIEFSSNRDLSATESAGSSMTEGGEVEEDGKVEDSDIEGGGTLSSFITNNQLEKEQMLR